MASIKNFACLAICLFALLASSCSDEEHIDPNNGNKKENSEKGRFDNSPFVWDVIYAPERSSDQIYVGDLVVQVVDQGINTGRVTDKILVTNPIGVYVGAVFPKSSYLDNFDREITSPKNPIDVVFDFKDPFIDIITRETGSVGYKISLKNALKSPEYRTNLSADLESLEYYFTEFSSYKDVEKAFTRNVGLGSIFSAQVESKGKTTQKKGRLLARLVSRNFNVYMDTPANGVFKDSILNANSGGGRSGGRGSRNENLIYTKSLTYGRAVYVAIESEYSYSEVKLALEAGIKFKFINANMGMDQKTTEVFSKSTITIFAVSENASSSYFMDALNNLNTLFTVKYSDLAYGYPIYLQGRYVHDNSAYEVTGF